MSTPCLVAVVVTFNRLGHLKTTLARLFDQGDVLSGIVVLDNGSTDGTAAWLATQTDPRLIFKRSQENLGGSGGFADAMKAARTLFDPDWIVLMDDDARPMVGAFDAFMAPDRNSADAWAARVINPDGSLNDMNRPWINPFRSIPAFLTTLLRGRDGFHITAKHDQISTVDGTSFIGLFLSRKTIDAIGYPDPALFIYGDDVLYTLAMTRAGLTLQYDPALCFEHDCETFSTDGTFTPLWKAYYYHRNQVFVYRAAAGPILFWPLVALRAALWWSKANRYGPDKSAYLELLGHALGDGLRGRKTRKGPAMIKKPRSREA